jgi:hypothetical protein
MGATGAPSHGEASQGAQAAPRRRLQSLPQQPVTPAVIIITANTLSTFFMALFSVESFASGRRCRFMARKLYPTLRDVQTQPMIFFTVSLIFHDTATV